MAYGGRQTGLRWVGATVLVALRPEFVSVVEVDPEDPHDDVAIGSYLDANGEEVMVPNEARASWFNATVLTTALSLGILAYALSATAIVVGLTLGVIGFVFLRIRSRAVLL